MKSRTTLAAAGLCAAMLALPGTADAATVTVTGDSGEAVALSEGVPVGIRNMSPTVAPGFAPNEKRYTIEILAPDGKTAASLGIRCARTDVADPEKLVYQGNGTYTVRITTVSDENDIYCEQGAQTQTFTFTINASTTLTGPGATLLLRKPGESSAIEHAFNFGLNPGVGGYALYYAANATLGPDNAIVGQYDPGDYYEDNADLTTGVAAITFPHTGNWTLVGRLLAGDGASPYTPPVKVKVVAPFDFADIPYFSDSRGPLYKVRGKLGDQSAAGLRIIVSLAKRKGKFKRIATPKIGAGGEFGFKFKQRRRGRYRLKYVFKGSEFMVAGAYTQKAVFRRF